MALEEHDREDLLGEGRMMPVRGECVIDDQTVVVGFRSGGQLSVYYGADPVFQFNAEKELRRVFFEGQRFAAQDGRLVQLRRESRGRQVQFVTFEVDVIQLERLLANWQKLRAAIERELDVADGWRVVEGSVEPLRERLRDWLSGQANVVIATVANA